MPVTEYRSPGLASYASTRGVQTKGAHEDGRSSRGVYNKAEYEVQCRHMMQQSADTVDAWIDGRKYAPMLLPQAMPLMELDPAL